MCRKVRFSPARVLLGTVGLVALVSALAAAPQMAFADASDAAPQARDQISEAPDATAEPSDAPAEREAEPKPEPRPELSPEMAEIRDRVRRTTLYYLGQRLNTQSNTAGDVVQLCLAFGAAAEIRAGNTSANSVNAIGALCWNYPCAGYQLLASDGGRIIARIGYGYQPHPGQFLAALAMTHVSSDYELRIDPNRGTVADLVRSEKLNCQSGTEMAFVLIGLATYLPDGATWENDLGQSWSLERLVKEELERPTDLSSAEVVYRLMGLSWAVKCEKEKGRSRPSRSWTRIPRTDERSGCRQRSLQPLWEAAGRRVGSLSRM